jgi:hypothetical protein
LALADMTITTKRQKDVDFSMPFMNTGDYYKERVLCNDVLLFYNFCRSDTLGLETVPHISQRLHLSCAAHNGDLATFRRLLSHRLGRSLCGGQVRNVFILLMD